jgi:hypothetical protein
MAQKVLPLNITVEFDAKSNGIYSWLIQMHGGDALILKQYKYILAHMVTNIKEGIFIAHTPYRGFYSLGCVHTKLVQKLFHYIVK